MYSPGHTGSVKYKIHFINIIKFYQATNLISMHTLLYKDQHFILLTDCKDWKIFVILDAD